jgi:hypothetical protein
MSIKSQIVDGTGNKNRARVDDEGAIHVIEHPHPPLHEDVEPLPFRQLFMDSSDSSEMNINGSSSSVDFYIEASPEFDIFVKTIFVEIEDGGNPNLNRFGALTELTNGVEWIYSTNRVGEYTLHEGIKTNKEFIRIGIDSAGFGDGVNAFLADVSGGGSSKSYLPIIDLGEMTGMRYGVRLKKASLDKLIFRVKDNLTGLVSFTAVAWGLRL